MWIKPTAFKHTGLFPEQLPNWQWMQECITATRAAEPERTIEVLNLFGYTGGASLACAQAGAHVVHVDSSKAAITWGRDNAEISGLSQAPIRWILDDARVFVSRELKRGRQYDAIILDPPAFGHGPKKELWKIEEHLVAFIAECRALLKPNALFMIVNGYAAGYSSLAYTQNLAPLIALQGGEIHGGELAIEEAPYEAQPGRLLPSGIFARWSRGGAA
jgi:23S rRNA (cytosine1962-C5)-methyltransferase